MTSKNPLCGGSLTESKTCNSITSEIATEAQSIHQIRYATNIHGKDKQFDFEKLNSGFQDKIGSIQDVVNDVKAGHALCAGLLGGKRRAKSNVIGSEWLLLDIDNSALLLGKDGKPVKGEDGKSVKQLVAGFPSRVNLSESL